MGDTITQQEPESKGKRFFSWLDKYVLQNLTGAIIVGIVALGFKYFEDGNDYLTYSVQKTEGILKNLRQVNRGSKFYIDNNEIADFSILAIDLFNDTGLGDYNVPISLKIAGKRSDLIGLVHFGNDGERDGLTYRDDTTDTGSHVIYTFVHPVINDLNSKPFATIRLAIRGSTIPEFTMGVTHKDFQIKEEKASTQFSQYAPYIILILFAIIVGLYIQLRIAANKLSKSQAKYFKARLAQIESEKYIEIFRHHRDHPNG